MSWKAIVYLPLAALLAWLSEKLVARYVAADIEAALADILYMHPLDR